MKNLIKNKRKEDKEKKLRSFDLLGTTALVRFPDNFTTKEKKKFAFDLMKKQKSIKTVLEKSGEIKGRLRKLSTNFIAGEDTKEIIYKENGCIFKFNIDNTYFSSRLSNERKEIASLIKPNESVLVMFSGVSPFPIVIAKNSKAKNVYSNELNTQANKYGLLNIKLNKVDNKVILIPGDINKVTQKIIKEIQINKEKIPKKFDVIVMPRPQLKDTFLNSAFILSKKGTIIYYYDFCKEVEKDKIVEKIKKEAKNSGVKIKILNIKNAGEIAPYKIRIRVDFIIT